MAYPYAGEHHSFGLHAPGDQPLPRKGMGGHHEDNHRNSAFPENLDPGPG